MTNNAAKAVLAVAVVGVVWCPAHAQIRPAYQYPADVAGKGGIQLGASGIYTTPYMGFAVGRDDNLFLSPTNEKSSTVLIFSPGLVLDARGHNSVFILKYQGQVGRYPQSDDDNYVDHTGRATWDFAFDRRNYLRVGLDALRLHDPRGSTDRPIAGRPDVYRQVTPSATYAFGAPGAAGRVEIYASESDRRYLNNRATTQVSDREMRDVGGVFYARVAPKTYMLAEARHTDISYKIPSPASGEEFRYYGGVSWEATAATTGTLKAGRLERKFDAGGEDTFSSWEGIISWSPRTYSKFDFFTSRQTNESTGIGRYVLSSIGGISWNHAWSSIFSTGVELRYQKDAFKGFDRTDEIRSLALRAGYKFRRWLTLGAEFSHTNRDSNSPSFEYDKNLYLVTATASM